MCMYSAESRGPGTGCPTDWHLTHLASRAAGGAGLIMVEATAVRFDGRITQWDLGLWNAEQEKAFGRIARGIREHCAVDAIQLAPAALRAVNRILAARPNGLRRALFPSFSRVFLPPIVVFVSQMPRDCRIQVISALLAAWPIVSMPLR
jgi:2,4-dienoyl-CoA reductase-like NADH-dependent reductase (Old Yellow Enzyme family)